MCCDLRISYQGGTTARASVGFRVWMRNKIGFKQELIKFCATLHERCDMSEHCAQLLLHM